jgi:D-serine dehydratase
VSTSPSAMEELLDGRLGVCHKAFPPSLAGVRVRDVGRKGLNVARGDLMLPALVLREEALRHNIETMGAWCERRGVSLAPHGKTTMAPQLFHRQLDAGAWAITAATVYQAAIMHRYGVRRVLLANQVTDRAGLRWLAEVLRDDPAFELLCLVDSVPAAALLHDALTTAGAAPPLRVLVELGVAGLRAGARNDTQAQAVAAAVRRSRHLRLVGVECFEGVIGPGRAPQAVAEVDRLLERVRELATRLDAAGAFADANELLLTAGGSVFFDRVADICPVGGLSLPTRVVLRSGCYVTHDSGAYESTSPLGGAFNAPPGERLRPALELWSAVLSRPEPELAVLGFGRRDAPFDAGLPRPLRLLGADGVTRPAGGLEIVALNDQHAMMRVPAVRRLEVGERVVCGISHPCTAFDKWSLLPAVDAHDNVVGAVRTLF